MFHAGIDWPPGGRLDICAGLVDNEDEDGRERTAIEVVLRREAPAWGGLPWKISALLRLYNQHECDLVLIREVPAEPEPSGRAIEDRIGWTVYSSPPEEAAAGGDQPAPSPAEDP